MVRIGLVLGAGGAVGHAYHAGVLAGLGEGTGWDPRSAEMVVGTSAGSVVGALLRAGASAPDIAARSTGSELSEEGQRLAARADAARNHESSIPSRAARRRPLAGVAAPGALLRAALQPWNARAGALIAAALPEGRVPTELVAAGLRRLFTGWPEQALWINALDLERGRRVTFGRGDSPHTDVATAVAASCAIPSFFAPVTIGGVRYVDGGVHSPTNADLLAGLGLDLVVISSPMSVARTSLRLAPDQPTRRLARYRLVREVARIRKAGTPVLTFQPTDEDLALMGLNAMDPSRSGDVTRQAFESTRRRIGRADARERLAILAGSPTPRA
jgi:NTE family protein